MISISGSKGFDPRQQVKDWKVFPAKNLWELSKVITRCVWSPMVFKDGYRKKDNFIASQFAVLDIDSGTTIQEAYERAKSLGLGFILAPTKSHQKEKKGIICDRFRLIFEFESVVKKLCDYEYTMSLLIKDWNSDPACKDGARFFYPSVKILNLCGGSKVHVSSEPPTNQDEIEKLARIKIRESSRYKHFGKYPRWVNDFLQNGQLKNDGRNSTCYAVSCKLFELGLTENEIFNLLNQAPFSRKDFSSKEVATAVKSARKRVIP